MKLGRLADTCCFARDTAVSGMSVKIRRTPADSLSELSELEIRTDHFRHLLGHQLFGGLCRFRRGLDVGRVIGDFPSRFSPAREWKPACFPPTRSWNRPSPPTAFSPHGQSCLLQWHSPPMSRDTGSRLVLLFLLVGGKACRRCGQVSSASSGWRRLFRR